MVLMFFSGLWWPRAHTYQVEAVLNTGPRTNHPNFVTVDGVNYAYLTVGDLGQTLVYRV